MLGASGWRFPSSAESGVCVLQRQGLCDDANRQRTKFTGVISTIGLAAVPVPPHPYQRRDKYPCRSPFESPAILFGIPLQPLAAADAGLPTPEKATRVRCTLIAELAECAVVPRSVVGISESVLMVMNPIPASYVTLDHAVHRIVTATPTPITRIWAKPV